MESIESNDSQLQIQVKPQKSRANGVGRRRPIDPKMDPAALEPQPDGAGAAGVDSEVNGAGNEPERATLEPTRRRGRQRSETPRAEPPQAKPGPTAHPLADLFPMMPEGDLADLAADIKVNGLMLPIALDEQGLVVDGRNRLKACELAGVEPRFEKIGAHDIAAYIIAHNVNRRHLTAGQRAMAVALIYPEPQQGKRTDLFGGRTSDVSRERLSVARTVLRHSRELALRVLQGDGITLDEAAQHAAMAQGADANRKNRLRKLREARPDLADAVDGDSLSLDGAEAKATADADALLQQRWAATMNLIDGVVNLDRDPTTAADIAGYYDAAAARQRGETITRERLLRVAEFAGALAAHWESNR